jgi:protein-L-isoaspartate(D-aspartate) O-methyltransferase
MVASQLRTNAVTDQRLIDAFASVPRDRFVPAERAALSYTDGPVPLSHERSLNPPMATARLIMAARLLPSDKVLLVGAASGYAAHIIAGLCASVVALEEVPALAAMAPSALDAPANVRFVTGELGAGFAELAPYDVIIIDGAIETLPQTLVDQCADGGRLVAAMRSGGVSRLSIGIKSNGAIGLKPFFDCQSVTLPGFSKAREFVF